MATHAVQIGMPAIAVGRQLHGRLRRLDDGRRDRGNAGLLKAHAASCQQGRAQGKE
jgi:hypothetical protein